MYPNSAGPKSNHVLKPWFLLGVVGLLAIAVAGFLYLRAPRELALTEETFDEVVRRLADDVQFSDVTLKQLRENHKTQLLRSSPAPQEAPDDLESARPGQWLNFESDGRLLFGCLRLPDGEGPHPMVVYCHGGFALGDSDIDAVSPLVERGFAVFVPAWRGENGNAGDFELYDGEVDDAVAAMEFVARLPFVDENAIYLAGHSAGATIALLAAELSDRAQAVMACGPVLDMTRLVEVTGGALFEEAPFAIRDQSETKVRSPGRFLNNLNCPIQLVYGEQEVLLLAQVESFKAHLQRQDLNVKIDVEPGRDHFTVLPDAIRSAADFFSARLATKRQTAAVTKAKFVDQWKDHIPREDPTAKLANTDPTVSIIDKWNSKPDPGPPLTDWSGFARWYNTHPYKLPRKPSFRIFPGNGHWMTSDSFENEFVIAAMDGSSQLKLKGALPSIPGRASDSRYEPAGVSLEGQHFAVLWSRQKSAGRQPAPLISFHQSSDGKILHTVQNTHACQFLPEGRVALFRRNSADPKQNTGQSVSVITLRTGSISEAMELKPDDCFKFSPGGKNLVVLRSEGTKVAMSVYSTSNAQLLSSGIYQNTSLGSNVAISNDGKEAFTVGQRQATVWNLETGQIVFKCRVSDVHRVASWLENRRFLVLDLYKVLDRETGRRVATMAQRVDTPTRYFQHGPWLATWTIRPGQQPVRRMPLEAFGRLLESRTTGPRKLNLSINLRSIGERRLHYPNNLLKGKQTPKTRAKDDRLEDHQQYLDILDYAVYQRIGADYQEKAKEQAEVVLEYSSYLTSGPAPTHRMLHGKKLSPDIPVAGIMNSPQGKLIVNLEGKLMPPKIVQQPFGRSSKRQSRFIAENFETVNAESSFDESTQFDVGLPWREQAQRIAVTAVFRKINFPLVDEFFLAPAKDTWKSIITAKTGTKAIDPEIATGRFFLEPSSTNEGSQSQSVKYVLRELLKDDDASIGALTFVRKDSGVVLQAGLQGPRIREYTLNGEGRDISEGFVSLRVARFQRDGQSNRWLATAGTNTIVIGDSRPTPPVALASETTNLRNLVLTSDGDFIVAPANQYEGTEKYTVWNVDRLVQSRRSFLPTPHSEVASPQARFWLPIPGSPDLVGIEDHAVHRINIVTGALEWRSELGDETESSPAGEILGNGRELLVQCQIGIEKVGIMVNLKTGVLTKHPWIRREYKQRVYSPDSTMFATVTKNDRVAICHSKTEELIWSTEIRSIDSTAAKVINLECLAWSPDSRFLGVACKSSQHGKKLSAIDVWDVSELNAQ